MSRYSFITPNHPEADGAAPALPFEEYTLEIGLESEGVLTVRMGRKDFCDHVAVLALVLAEDAELRADAMKALEAMQEDDPETT